MCQNKKNLFIYLFIYTQLILGSFISSLCEDIHSTPFVFQPPYFDHLNLEPSHSNIQILFSLKSEEKDYLDEISSRNPEY